jgi:hypothetical protein
MSEERFLYGTVPANVRPAAEAKGVLIRTLDGTLLFRVYDGPESFTDYEIRHGDLNITIDPDALAAFYRVGQRDILDYDPRVLGLRKVEE